MEENTNKAIAINSIINYIKMGVNTILSLLTTRLALQALGVSDFGLFSVLGSIITFISIFNAIMLSTSNRFLAVAIGKNDTKEINKQFNVNLIIFIGLALLMLVVSYPIGYWYIHNYINYNGPIENATMVFILSIIGSVISTIAIPFNGLLIAKERFVVFSSVEILVHFIKFIVALILVYYCERKLLIYSLTMAFTAIVPTIAYWRYCSRTFKEYVSWNLVKQKNAYTDIFSFSGWIAYGAVACIAKNQGGALLVNAFFNTVMNTALGLANSLIAYIQMFANNLTQPIQPQITKSYVNGNFERIDELLIMSTKFSFMLMLLISTPFFVGGEWLLSLWLGNVPPYTLSFTILLIIDSLIGSFNSGLSVLIHASGKIALYQITINTLRLLSIVAAFFVLKAGVPPEGLFVTYIVFTILIVITSQLCLRKTLGYDTKNLVRKSYIPSLLITLCLAPAILVRFDIHPALSIAYTLAYLISLEFFIGLTPVERSYIKRFLHHLNTQ